MCGSGVPGTMSRSSHLREKYPGRERCGPDDGYAVSKNPSYTNRIPQAGFGWKRKIAAVEEGGRGTQNAIRTYIKRTDFEKF